jgi:hypothetical protein
MTNKYFFFLRGKDQYGPFSLEELVNKGLTSETLIWTEGMENWQKLKDLPGLAAAIKPKSVPPPPPFDKDETISKTEVSGQLKVTTERVPNQTLEAIKPNKATLIRLIIWCSFHLFALLMSYSRVKIFHFGGKPRTDRFWPFVKIQEEMWNTVDKKYYIQFNGIFYNYDWSEFSFYVCGAIVIYLLVRISNKKEVSNE